MKKIYMQMAVTASLSLFVSGCLEPTSRSMGATLMPAPLMHRASADSSSSEMSVTASGFWGHTGDDYNVKDLNAGGGNVGFTYRMGGALSPFFVNIAAGGFGGSLKFGCDEGSKCNPSSLTKTENAVPLDGDAKYAAWLRSDAGKESYSFWNIQERILAGVDCNMGAYVILGFACGAQLFQGASDYDDAREKLDDLRIVDDVDGKSGAAFATAYWLGLHLGRHGQYGNLVAEYDFLHKGSPDNWTSSLKFTYAHPTGFFAGLANNNLMSVTVYAGKQFVF